MSRNLTLADRLVGHLDRALRACSGTTGGTERPNPGDAVDPAPMTDAQRHHAAGLMRVNHAGEIAAQALYHGQAFTARDPAVRDAMEHSAVEELDHLAWCERRVNELGESVSRLGPFWYAGSFGIGALAGLMGDRFSLGFIAETEKQVVDHLDEHLGRLPEQDARSRAILQTMREDEEHHGEAAREAGGEPLPEGVRRVMSLVSKVMTRTAYHI